MSKNKSNCKQGDNVYSDRVGSITEPNVKVNADMGMNGISMVKHHIKGSNKFGGIIMILLIVIFIIVLTLLIFYDSKKDTTIISSNDTDKTIFEEAYENLKFEEDASLTKLSCSKRIPKENAGIEERETLIYYFSKENTEISIYHIDIVLSDEYMDYYDKIYNEYDKLLKNDYNYDNVDTNITRWDNEILVTVITYAKKNGNKLIGIKPFLSYEDAKVTTINDGYICE